VARSARSRRCWGAGEQLPWGEQATVVHLLEARRALSAIGEATETRLLVEATDLQQWITAVRLDHARAAPGGRQAVIARGPDGVRGRVRAVRSDEGWPGSSLGPRSPRSLAATRDLSVPPVRCSRRARRRGKEVENVANDDG
jgi:hypothetical protein